MEALDNLRRRAAASVRRHPKLWTLLNPPYRATRDALNVVRLLASCRREMIFSAGGGNDAVRKVIETGAPAALGKIGSLEAEAVTCFLKGSEYPEVLRRQMLDNVGIHPVDRESLDAFCRSYLHAVDNLDVLAARGHPGETQIINRVRNRTLVRLRSFESWLHPRPWSSALQGRRVLVITPFARSVLSQYQKRAGIWRDLSVLPPFELRVVRMPLSPGLVPPLHKNWQERYQELIDDCDRTPYDIMLVGAGGLSLPLIHHARTQGKIGFHLGGHMQILFGITGRRWDRDRVLHSLQTPAWIRPTGDEAPPTVAKVEQGCYW